ncbi:enoyl-CoA hydratase/isomerase family protein [Pseudorhodoplanes sp.]|uniref:enoyl-CoA hydratase/isomerase family protein n=1 Tax=Pseudorhodoplanes sp. TaxID=1934341 RepID=UPI002C3B36A0|nr:enoyl-CoA hydratase-related protein [Pseudorhodoplanes sp.]HWV51543.1 enoyl-CoA hydratase-related protein [Pseudorhodoplanes sp.]
MSEKYIRYEVADGIAVITIDRPAKRNALTSAMCADLHAAWQTFAASDNVRVAILTAAGDDVFTAGADLNDPPPQFWQGVPNLGVPVSKPIITAVSGLVIGAGVPLVAMSDLCIASTSTRFIYPEAKVGVALGLVSSIVTRIPHKVAMELMLMGEPVSAERAYQVGLVNRLVAPGEQLSAAREMASILVANAPLVMGMLKDMALAALPKAGPEAMFHTQRAINRVLQSEDAKEGPRAFLEKRKPTFRGR